MGEPHEQPHRGELERRMEAESLGHWLWSAGGGRSATRTPRGSSGVAAREVRNRSHGERGQSQELCHPPKAPCHGEERGRARARARSGVQGIGFGFGNLEWGYRLSAISCQLPAVSDFRSPVCQSPVFGRQSPVASRQSSVSSLQSSDAGGGRGRWVVQRPRLRADAWRTV